MSGLDDAPLFGLVSSAQQLARQLDDMGMTSNGELVRELCRRVVPVRIVPTTGAKLEMVRDPVPIVHRSSGPIWCDQCDRRVKGRCASPFCKVAA